MSSLIPINQEEAKAQAKRLRKYLASHGVEFSHSQCLEAVANSFGQKDWNTLVAKQDEAYKKTYLVICFADMKESANDETCSGYFNYLLKASSPEEVVETCIEEFSKFSTDDNPFNTGDKLFIYHIIELDEIPDNGVLLDLKLLYGDYSFIANPIPLSANDDSIGVYSCSFEEDDENAVEEPLLILGQPSE